MRAIDWMRGFVMILMTIDHAGTLYDAGHMHGDAATGWVPGSPLPPGEFVTRWISHLCAPVFVLLAGTSMALSSEKRQGEAGQTAFIVKRGLFIAALDPLWMALGFATYQIFPLQVLYAIGTAMVMMAFLRKLPSPALLTTAVLVAVFGELSTRVAPASEPWVAIWKLLWTKGRIAPRLFCAYPAMPWLSIMMTGWVIGRWLLLDRQRAAKSRAGPLALLGAALLAVFGVVRGVDRYGNWGLYRDSSAALQWLHVAKYPPSLAFMTLELGIGFLLLAVFFALDDGRDRRLLAPLGLLGRTAFFYYLLHVHVLALAGYLLRLDPHTAGLAKTYLGAAAVLVFLYPLCARYASYKAAHPDGWTRYV